MEDTHHAGPEVEGDTERARRIATNLRLFQSSLAPEPGDVLVDDLPPALDILVLTSRRSPVYDRLDNEHVEVQPTWEDWLVTMSGLDAQSKCVPGGVSVSASPQQYVKFLQELKSSGRRIRRLMIEDHHASIRYLLNKYSDVLLSVLSDAGEQAGISKIGFLTCTSGGMIQEDSPLLVSGIKLFDTGNGAVTVSRAMGIKLGTDPYSTIAIKLRREVAEFFAATGCTESNIEDMANMFIGNDNPAAKLITPHGLACKRLHVYGLWHHQNLWQVDQKRVPHWDRTLQDSGR